MESSLQRFQELLDVIYVWISHNLNYFSERGFGLNVVVRTIMVSVSLLVIWFLFKRMLKSQIKESAFLMWTLPAFLLFVYGVWPEITYYISDLTNMTYGYALVVTVPFISLLYYLAFKQMCQISALMSKVLELGSVVSIQKHEIAELHREIASLREAAGASRTEPAESLPSDAAPSAKE